MVKRSRHRPFTAVTRVRFPVGSPKSAAHLCGAFLFVSAASFAKKTPLTFADKPTIIRLACSEGKSFVGNDGLDKTQAEMPVLIRPFLRFWGQPALRPAAQAAHPKAWRQFYEFPDGQHSAHLLQIPHLRLRQRPDLVHLRRGGRGHGGPVPGPCRHGRAGGGGAGVEHHLRLGLLTGIGGSVLFSPLGSPSGRAVTEGD